MLISVVIPLYNKEKYILRTIESVLAQNHSNFELIIVDDGSTDKSADFVVTKKDDRIQLIKQKNEGVSKARNTGVKRAKGEWVAFLDADDEYLPDFLKEASAFLKNHQGEELSFIGTNYFLGCENEIAIDESINSGIYDYFELFKNQRSPNNSSTTIVNKCIFLEVGGFPEDIKQYEDWITWFKLACAGNFGYINIPLGRYHIVENSVSNSSRNLNDYFKDAQQLPRTTLLFIDKYKLSHTKIKNAKNRISEFSLNIASILAHDGMVFLAFKMLNYVSLRVIMNEWRKTAYLLLHLTVPQLLKKTYWKLRWGN